MTRSDHRPTHAAEQPLWRYLVRRTQRKFTADRCTDLAAGLTFHAVISIFPALLATLTLLSVISKEQTAVNAVLRVLKPLVSSESLAQIAAVLRDFGNAHVSGWALVGTIALSLWTASGYVNAFGRAMNRILEVPEGRPIWKARPAMFAVTLVLILLVVVLLVVLTVSGGMASSIGQLLGLSELTQQLWSLAKWPAFLLVATFLTAVLYWATPNVRRSRIRWTSIGAAVAVLVWMIASWGLSFYIARFANYNRTYGSLAGAVIALLFLYVSNLALLIGAEVDAELERLRQLKQGIHAEERLQWDLRATSRIIRTERSRQRDLAYARALREEAGREAATEEADPAQ